MAGGYEHKPQGIEGMARKLRTMQADLDAMRRSLAALGIRVDGATGDLIFGTDTGDVQIQAGSDLHLAGGDLLVEDGSIIASGGPVESGNFVHGSSGWRASQSGNLEVNDLTVRDAIIGNNALTSPVFGAAAFAIGSGYSIPSGTGSGGGGTELLPDHRTGRRRESCLRLQRDGA
jgi:hypothetical protein